MGPNMHIRLALYAITMLMLNNILLVDSTGYQTTQYQPSNTAIIIYQGRQYVVDANQLFAKLQTKGGTGQPDLPINQPNGQQQQIPPTPATEIPCSRPQIPSNGQTKQTWIPPAQLPQFSPPVQRPPVPFKPPPPPPPSGHQVSTFPQHQQPVWPYPGQSIGKFGSGAPPPQRPLPGTVTHPINGQSPQWPGIFPPQTKSSTAFSYQNPWQQQQNQYPSSALQQQYPSGYYYKPK